MNSIAPFQKLQHPGEALGDGGVGLNTKAKATCHGKRLVQQNGRELSGEIGEGRRQGPQRSAHGDSGQDATYEGEIAKSHGRRRRDSRRDEHRRCPSRRTYSTG